MRNIKMLFWCFIGIYSQVVSAEEICGTTVNSLWSQEKNTIVLESMKTFEDKLCDSGKQFPGANIVVQFMDKNNKIIFQKYDRFTFESISHSSGREKKDYYVKNDKGSKIIKFPKFKKIENIVSYKILSLESSKILGEGKFKL